MRFLFADRKDIRDWFYRRKGRAGIMARSEGTTMIPEHSFLPSWWNERARGLGATIHIPISTGGEENLLCERPDRYYNEDIFLHEFVHGIHNLGATGAIPTFDRRLKAAYESARSNRLWWRTYALSTDREYFAEGKLPQPFKMDSKDGGTVVTLKPETPPVPSTTSTSSVSKPTNPDTPPVPTSSKSDTPPVPTLPTTPNTPSVSKPTYPDTPPVTTPTVSKSSTSHVTTPQVTTTPKRTHWPTSIKQCNNHHKHCNDWAKTGECQRNPAYMLLFCCRSCKIYKYTTTPRVTCRDNHKNCRFWAYRGHCRYSYYYMTKKLQKQLWIMSMTICCFCWVFFLFYIAGTELLF
ncbi:gamete and mating-type specific protein A-like isoform X3 [Xenia sp. Carnegie-2017]|uniref:gamete and mating-type specific protein A-like isoform X3 n=1 Tax=Xenia sp. Carnegie-2017 TaxID=2897299 RepID=UPI001F03E63D|nr:gamete and mating-type specific protein A-like isoform X3 [Xenia sp. Carnegie-2017]